MWKALFAPILERKFADFILWYRRFITWQEHKKAGKRKGQRNRFTELFWAQYFGILRAQRRNSMIRQVIRRPFVSMLLIGWIFYGIFYGRYGWGLNLFMISAIILGIVYAMRMIWSTREVFLEADRHASAVLYEELLAIRRTEVKRKFDELATSLKNGLNDDGIDQAVTTAKKAVDKASDRQRVNLAATAGISAIQGAAASNNPIN